MSRISIKIDVDFSEGELQNLAGKIWNEAEQRILTIVRQYDNGDGVTKREISMNAGRKAGDAQNRDAILAELIKTGIIEIVSGSPNKRGTRYAIKKTRKG